MNSGIERVAAIDFKTAALTKLIEVTMNTLSVDVGGTNVKILASGQTDARRFPPVGS